MGQGVGPDSCSVPQFPPPHIVRFLQLEKGGGYFWRKSKIWVTPPQFLFFHVIKEVMKSYACNYWALTLSCNIPMPKCLYMVSFVFASSEQIGEIYLFYLYDSVLTLCQVLCWIFQSSAYSQRLFFLSVLRPHFSILSNFWNKRWVYVSLFPPFCTQTKCESEVTGQWSQSGEVKVQALVSWYLLEYGDRKNVKGVISSRETLTKIKEHWDFKKHHRHLSSSYLCTLTLYAYVCIEYVVDRQ